VATVQKYLCAPGYPTAPKKGGVVQLPTIGNDDTVRTFFAGVASDGQNFTISGGRSIGVVGLGKNLDEANQNCEKKIAEFSGDFVHRSDIGSAELTQQRIDMMQQLRGELMS